MKSFYCLGLIAFLTLHLQAQQPNLTAIAQKIEAEANDLYQTELASWHGTDLFLKNYTNKANIGGYVSYVDGSKRKCVFVSKADTPIVIGTILFDSTFNFKTADVQLTERFMTTYEKDLYEIRKVTLTEVSQDTLFKHYKNTDYNLIPIIKGDAKKVYILTGSTTHGNVLLGNDYLLEFNKNNKIFGKKKLHKGLIPVPYSDGKEHFGGFHTHVLDDFMTATDICTIMLYSKLAKWKQHVVMSEKYVSIWNCERNQLLILTKEAFDRISAHQDQLHSSLEQLKLTETDLPKDYTLTKNNKCNSLQTNTFYNSLDIYEVLIGKVKSKQVQNFNHKTDSGSIFYFEFESKFEATAFLEGLLWGDKKPSKKHPEMFYVKNNFLIIWSFKQGSALPKVSEKKIKKILE